MQEQFEEEEKKIEDTDHTGSEPPATPPSEPITAAEDWQEKYIRLYSEFDNFRKRTAREKTEWMKTAGEDILKKMLPIFDDFERAMQAHSAKAAEKTPFEEGIYLIFHKLKSSFESVGLKEMDMQNKNFNSDYHEAIARIKTAEAVQSGQIVEVVEKGYLFNGKIIRHAKVVIAE